LIFTEQHNERLLLQQVAKGDEEAFSILFKRYYQFLATHIFRITESREMAEEVVQDVFLKIWMAREALPEIQNIRSYLVTLSRNHGINTLKRQLREWEKLSEFITYERQVSKNLQTSNTKDFQGTLIDEAIDNLPPRQKQVYLLHRHERQSYDQIAAKLGVGKESVKKNLQLASRSITDYIKGRLVSLLFLLEFFWNI
jgi:RNA polymerase sigma-70 factor (family 1)